MRLSSMKSAHAVPVAPRAGNPHTWAEKDGRSPTIAFAKSISNEMEGVPQGLKAEWFCVI
jgi:hypothetical protein